MVDWWKLLKWLGLIVLAIAIVGAPMVYVNRLVDKAHDKGYQQGMEFKQQEIDKIIIAHQEQEQRIMQEESEQAQERLIEGQKHAQEAATLRTKLQIALKAQPEVVGCLLNEPVADILRDAANGRFDPETYGTTLPSRPAPKVPASPTDPAEGGHAVAGTR